MRVMKRLLIKVIVSRIFPIKRDDSDNKSNRNNNNDDKNKDDSSNNIGDNSPN